MSQVEDPGVGPEKGPDEGTSDIAAVTASQEVSTIVGTVKTEKSQLSSPSDRQIKYKKAQQALENAALVSKRIKEHRKAAAELLGKPFDDDDTCDAASDMASVMSERTGYSAATDVSTTLSVQEALNIPGISESLANTLKQKEILMERIKQYKEQASSKRPTAKSSSMSRRESLSETKGDKKFTTKVENSDIAQLQSSVKEKDNVISIMQVKMKAMEATVMDLQEKISEKDQIIDAKNKATSLMSDNISKKEKDSLILLEETRLQMTKMQENFIAMETEWKEEKGRLLDQLKERNEHIRNLEEANSILETARFELTVENSELIKKIDANAKTITDLEMQLQKVKLPDRTEEEEKGSKEIAGMEELTKKIELLEQLNCEMRQANKELENKLATANPLTKTPAQTSPSKKASPLPTRKGGKSTKMKSPWSNLSTETIPKEGDKKQGDNSKPDAVIQSLSKDILEKEYVISQKDSLLNELEAKIAEKEELINQMKQQNVSYAEIGVNTHNVDAPIERAEIKKEIASLTSEETAEYIRSLEQKIHDAQEQIVALTNELDTANKNMVKVKSNHKLKLKQMQKTVDSFSKMSDANVEVVRLNEEINQLSLKVAELEEEKGNLQLHLVDYDSGRLTDTDAYKKVLQLEALAESRLKAISHLETQKLDLVQELHILKQKNDEMEDKLADIIENQNEQVSSEIKSVQLEEEIDKIHAAKRDLEITIDNMKMDIQQLEDTIKQMENDKHEMEQKLEHYIQENIDLTDKIEKMSTEKVSSAESIEMVESLSTQDTLELEEYNKRMLAQTSTKSDNLLTEKSQESETECIQKLRKESADLNQKIDLFSQEREEVMDKMNKITFENEQLQHKIFTLNIEMVSLQSNIEAINKEKNDLEHLNEDLVLKIEELKKERMDLMKDSVDLGKPAITTEEVMEASTESHPEDKSAGDKSAKGVKSVKQLTKDILKLKNVIKEREAEIADCQMKILSLEEQQQKHSKLVESNNSYESRLKLLSEENDYLKQENMKLVNQKEVDNQFMNAIQQNEALQQEIRCVQQEYTATINSRDIKINELQNVLIEYEKQMQNYASIIQQKDKELSEYINQVTKLNDVAQKLRSTIEVLEEEKEKDQNSELIKSLNKQINVYQKKLTEYEEHLKNLEEEKSQISSVKVALETQNNNIETELQTLKDRLAENQNLITDLQLQQSKNSAEMAELKHQTKERDEEIHQIKLQLRKESIENEKLRDELFEKDKIIEAYTQELEDVKEKLSKSNVQVEEANSQYTLMENKNAELMEKLKKFAGNLKKRTLLNSELESKLQAIQSELELKNKNIEQLSLQVGVLPNLQEKLKCADEEITRLMTIKSQIENQKASDVTELINQNNSLKQKLSTTATEIENYMASISSLNTEISAAKSENDNLKYQIETLNKKMIELEMEQRNNINFLSKIASLENEITQKQSCINELEYEISNHQQAMKDVQCGLDAKLQEKELYIEGLEIELTKYKDRITRLEQSISTMEDRRNSLERKADQLDSQLQEKQKAYSEYTSQEDELVCRLVSLMNHDREMEKQLEEIKNENRELQSNVGRIYEENESLKKYFDDIEGHYCQLKEKESHFNAIETEFLNNQQKIINLEANLKKTTTDFQALVSKSKQEFEELEVEFHTQIENAIKDKKIISEKYEKLTEIVKQLEHQNHEYVLSIQNLNANLEELSRVNQESLEKSLVAKANAPDYTEQYISEINRLNAVINRKNEDCDEINSKLQSLKSNLDDKVSELREQLDISHNEIRTLTAEVNTLKQQNEKLHNDAIESESKMKQLIDKKRVTFEMSIPKTEGLVISSTIESLEDAPLQAKVDESVVAKTPDNQAESDQNTMVEVIEPTIVRKDAYLCYKGDTSGTNIQLESDPFNSDEGWGLEETEPTEDVIPGFSHFNNQIIALQNENKSLQQDIEARNLKLQKALKKLKELKATNEILTNEMKLSKQMQSSSLDLAMEDEFVQRISELEKQADELQKEVAKEKREKEALAKQNEIIQNANDRLMEMKEKLENDIELWKYRFTEANNKANELDWGSDEKVKSGSGVIQSSAPNKYKEEIVKLEKENDEMMGEIDRVSSENKELLSRQAQLIGQINSLQKDLNDMQSSISTKQDLEHKLSELQTENNELTNSNKMLTQQIKEINENHESILTQMVESRLLDIQKEKEDLLKRTEELEHKLQILNDEYTDVCTKNTNFASEYENLQRKFNEETALIIEKNQKLEQEIISTNDKLEEYKQKSSLLIAELTETRSKIIENDELQTSKAGSELLSLNEKYSALENYCGQLKAELDIANAKAAQLLSDNQSLIDKLNELEKQIVVEQDKVQKLNSENDSLLATVTELQSTMNTAVDQRGYEIAELWKQHLAQRETDFQNLEQELRLQITTCENKYEQLLDSVQSSSQEETNKLVVLEQINGLQTKLKDKEDHLHDLQEKYSQALSDLELLRSEIEDKKILLENKLLSQQEDFQKQLLTESNKNNITNLTETIEKLQNDLEEEKTTSSEVAKQNKEVAVELTTYLNEMAHQCRLKDAEIANLTETIEKLQNDLEEEKTTSSEVAKQNKEVAVELTTYLNEMAHQLRLKDAEIHQKTNDVALTLGQRNEEFANVRKLLVEYEKKIEDLSFEKESELAVLRLKIHENNDYFENEKSEWEKERIQLTEDLNAKILECTAFNKQITDLNKALEEHSINAAEMQTALENQEIEILTLKEEIVHLDGLLKASSSKIEKHVHFASDTKPGDTLDESNLLDFIPKAELDLALYMMHQRDVRCEELTMELTQLLDERDTLQLRLSDSLRSCEELKKKCEAAGLEVALNTSQDVTHEVPSVSGDSEQAIVEMQRSQTSRSSSISDPDGDKPKLQAKLTELKTVRHSRDVTLRQDSESRQLGVRLMQRDVANLPPEAMQQLTQAHHSLSRNAQSTPTVLLNWLRGKSTPKVVHM